MRLKFEILFYSIWLNWERARLEVREKTNSEIRENIELLEKLVTNLKELSK